MIFCFYLLIFVLGLCCGSFVNMLVYRTAWRYELESRKFKVKSKKRSFCDYCGRQLKWYENIPVFSWIMQKGKTRCCHKKLSVLYPIVEITTGLLFLIFNLKFEIFNQFLNQNFQTLIQFGLGLLIIIFLVFSAVFDLKYMILPDFSTILLVISALVYWLIGYFGEWNYWISAIASFMFLYFLYLITQKKGMGLGDVKLAVFMGLFLGKNVILAFYIAFVVGALTAIILMVFGKVDKKTAVPFGPFLILGSLVSWFWGNELVSFSVSQFFR